MPCVIWNSNALWILRIFLLNPQPPCARKTFTILRNNKKRLKASKEGEKKCTQENRTVIRRSFMRKYFFRNLIMSFCCDCWSGWRLVELISWMVEEKKKITSTNNQNIQMNSNKMLIQYLVFKSQYRATVLIFLSFFLVIPDLITNIIKSFGKNKSFIFVLGLLTKFKLFCFFIILKAPKSISGMICARFTRNGLSS